MTVGWWDRADRQSQWKTLPTVIYSIFTSALSPHSYPTPHDTVFSCCQINNHFVPWWAFLVTHPIFWERDCQGSSVWVHWRILVPWPRDHLHTSERFSLPRDLHSNDSWAGPHSVSNVLAQGVHGQLRSMADGVESTSLFGNTAWRCLC